MSGNPFYKLAPVIQEYIYKKRWDTLRPAQDEALNICFGTRNHLLIAAGTASGKTEAAFFPAMSELHERPATRAGRSRRIGSSGASARVFSLISA